MLIPILLGILLSACNTSVVTQTPETTKSPETTPDTTLATDTSDEVYVDPATGIADSSADITIGSAIDETASAKLIEEEPPVGDLWDTIRDGFEFAEIPAENEHAEKRIAVYRKRLTRSSSLINSVTDNATPYLHFVVTELKKHNMPLEIALLPIVESRYDPFAYSPGRASGLWQFIPGTGKRFGLAQDWWHDERRDTIASTGAAIQYLIYLHKLFDGDWLLAMASYNAGQGNVLKAIRKNRKKGKPTDYWSLDLPRETQHYIPKLLAWRDIIKHSEKYNITLNPIPDEAYFTIVDIGSQIDLAEAATLAEVDIDTIYELNAAFNRWATDPSPPHDLLVPYDSADTLKEKLNELPPSKRMTWRRYIIQKNDSLIKIAKKFNTSPTLIASVNGVKNNRIRAGKALLIPSARKESEYYSLSAEQRLAKRQNRSPKKHAERVEHRVRSGESLWDIAKKYNVGVKALARWNHMAPGDVLSVNKKLVVWTKKASSATTRKIAKNETRKLFYTVKRGDSLAYIANRFRVRVKDIKSWNNIATQKYIKPGQLLTLYVALTDRQLIVN